MLLTYRVILFIYLFSYPYWIVTSTAAMCIVEKLKFDKEIQRFLVHSNDLLDFPIEE